MEDWDDTIPSWATEDDSETTLAEAIRAVSDLALVLAGSKETSFMATALRTVEDDEFRMEYLSVEGHEEVVLKIIFVDDQLETISIVHEKHAGVQVFLPPPDFLVCAD
jgi:hypothetical protein